MNSYSESYKAAGVDVTAGYESVRLIKDDVKRTEIPGCISGIGGFGGLFQLDVSTMAEPVLVSGTDGVGTKLKIAMLLNKHDTIGIDCVAMCVNDIICCGAKPLYFLDYIAIGKNYPEKVASIVKGVADGCVMAGCALIGGETAEHPGMMAEDEYDIAGYSTGVVDKSKIIDNTKIKTGDAIIGIASSGVHSNGFSLVRKVFNINEQKVKTFVPELKMSLGEALLTPTKIYVKPVLDLISKVNVKGISHITGGGFYENIPRMLPEGISAKIMANSWQIPEIFKLIQKEGNITEHDMYNTFNMGIGMAIVVADEDKQKAVDILTENGEEAHIIGSTVEGTVGVLFGY